MSSPFVMQAGLSLEDAALLQQLENKVNSYNQINKLLKAYYEGNIWLNKIGFSVPPRMREFQTVVGWPAIIVDVIEERLKWKGWFDLSILDKQPQQEQEIDLDPEADPLDDIQQPATVDAAVQKFFDDVYIDNSLEAEAPMVHLDALIFGCGFATVGTRDPNDLEKTPLVTTESTELTTGIYDPQRRRLTSGVVFRTDDDGNIMRAALMKLDETIYLRRLGVGARWIIEDKDQHNLGRLPLVPFINRPMGSRRSGRSEITRPIRGYTDIGVRTILGMETNREFFSAPQRYVLGATEDDFRDEAGNKIPGWQSVIGRIWGIGRNEDGELPEVGEFTPAPSRPYLEQIQGLSQLVAADGAVPQTYLGFMSDNPASADSIRALESRLIKRSERRITSFGWSWGEVGRLTWMMQNPGEAPPRLDTDWGNPATPTMQADADWAIKLIAAKVISPDSTIARNRLGFSKSEQAIIEQENRRQEAKERVKAARDQAAALKQTEAMAEIGARFGNDNGAGSGVAPGKAGAGAGASNSGSGGGRKPRPSGGRVPNGRDYAKR
ncbi:portal protein [Mycobacterium phage JacoRen57]|nr:portal protein [Mycobacterium phage JacoRen57]